MATITNKQIDNLLIIAGNFCGLEEVLAKAIESKDSEQIKRVQHYLTIVRERLISAINDIDR